ncbi:MAG: hypothetical protein K2N95_13795 [Lachnospiraceae bacterium]|nr:hypothetical protein [Lachnospiraceae bacterium]
MESKHTNQHDKGEDVEFSSHDETKKYNETSEPKYTISENGGHILSVMKAHLEIDDGCNPFYPDSARYHWRKIIAEADIVHDLKFKRANLTDKFDIRTAGSFLSGFCHDLQCGADLFWRFAGIDSVL